MMPSGDDRWHCCMQPCKSCPWPTHVQPLRTPNTVENTQQKCEVIFSPEHNHRRSSSWGTRRRRFYTRRWRCETRYSSHGCVIAPRKTLGRGEHHAKNHRVFDLRTAPVVRCANLILERKLPQGLYRVTTNRATLMGTKWHRHAKQLVFAKRPTPRDLSCNVGRKSAFCSARCLRNASFSSGGQQAMLRAEGTHTISKKREEEYAGFNDEMSTVTRDCVTNTGSG